MTYSTRLFQSLCERGGDVSAFFREGGVEEGVGVHVSYGRGDGFGHAGVARAEDSSFFCARRLSF